MDTPKSNHVHAFEVKTSNGYTMVNSRSILFLEAKGKFTIIHLSNKSNIVTYHMLKWFTDYLIEPYFFRCHNSYLISCSCINYYNHKEIFLKEGPKVPLLRRRSVAFKENLKSFVLGENLV